MIHSIGHSAHSGPDFLALLLSFAIEVVVDIRAVPRSRRHPQFERTALNTTLTHAGIAYEWWGERLGGRRVPRPASRNIALADASLRGFADHMDSAEFRDAAQALAARAARQRHAFMCAEANFTACHRQLLADYLQLTGTEVRHIVGHGDSLPHTLNAALGDARDPPVYNRAAQGDLFA